VRWRKEKIVTGDRTERKKLKMSDREQDKGMEEEKIAMGCRLEGEREKEQEENDRRV